MISTLLAFKNRGFFPLFFNVVQLLSVAAVDGYDYANFPAENVIP